MRHSLPFIQKLFITKTYNQSFWPKEPNLMNSVIPNINSTLLNLSKQFIDGIIQGDIKSISSISSVELASLLRFQLEIIKESSIKITSQDVQSKQEKEKVIEKQKMLQGRQVIYEGFQSRLQRPSVSINPYMIFGDVMANRQEHNYQYSFRLMKNKMFLYDSQKTFVKNLECFYNHQILGFHCFYVPLKRYSVSGNIQRWQHRQNRPLTLGQEIFFASQDVFNLGNIFFITFQTDSQQLNYKIVDVQGILHQINQK